MSPGWTRACALGVPSALVALGSAVALPILYDNECASCHIDDTPTCAGCHNLPDAGGGGDQA